MPILWVPDDQHDGFPYKISPTAKNLVDYELLKFLINNWDALGSGKTSDLPDPGSVAQVSQVSMDQLRSGAISNYEQKASALKTAFNDMQAKFTAVVKQTTKDTKEDRLQYQSKMGGLINTLSAYADKAPQGDMSMDDYIMGYVSEGLESGTDIYKDTLKQMSDNAGKIDDQAKQIADLEQKVKDGDAKYDKLQKEYDALKKQGTGTGTGTGNGSYDPGQVQQTGTGTGTGSGTNDTWQPVDLGADGSTSNGSSTGTGTGGSDGTGTGSGSTGSGDSGSSYPSSTTPTQASYPDSGTGSGVGSGMSDMMNSLGQQLQALAQQQQMRDMMNQYGQNGLAQQQPVAAQPAVATQPQAQAQPAATTTPPGAPASSTTPPPGTSSSQPGQGQPGGPVPGHTPGTDGKVDYNFPNGETQRVWAVAALGLDAAFGNQSGTDAQAAYDKTPAKWSDKKQIGKSVDPNDMTTGDVAVWKDRTAVVAKFGTPEAGGRLEAIIAGKLQELTSDNLHQLSDTAGEFGEFSGFFHPPGIEAPVAGDQSGQAPGGAPTGDQSGAPMLAATGGAPA